MIADPVVIVRGARTPIGRFGGALKDVEASDLAGVAIAAALDRARVAPDEVDEVIMGQVGQVGADAYNARRCGIAAGIPVRATAMNVNRLCGSGLQAIITATGQLLLGDATVIVAGGDESMSRQPFLDYDARAGWRLGTRELVDGTLSLVTDPFGGYPMGETAERVAERHRVTREDQDRFAITSQARAAHAIAEGHVDDEIAPVDVPRGNEPVRRDETSADGVRSRTPRSTR